MFQTRAMVIFFVGLGCGTLIAVGEWEIIARCTDGCKGYCLEGFLCDDICFGWVVFHPQNWSAHPQNFASLALSRKLVMVLGAVQVYYVWCDVVALVVPLGVVVGP
eukprot:scaffold39555_cov54-Attheya_sp.AAC.2